MRVLFVSFLHTSEDPIGGAASKKASISALRGAGPPLRTGR